MLLAGTAVGQAENPMKAPLPLPLTRAFTQKLTLVHESRSGRVVDDKR